ncbi:peptide deformylase [Streptomyces chumphonensis]|uniref:Peptide deformylase n=1 Tax=Streptomyces chumphonensis TaxID=1214925 RepID=A0A927IEN6_9ACTN|nr:peptide deformylase [Streptomyces chumphonensis]MBD3933914.1 peptide deformylase [Streptomyces chumphonensis]
MQRRAIPGSSGRVHPVTLFGTAVLHRPCEEVTAFGASLAGLVEDLFASMYAARGVGLAANQIGTPLRVFVYDCPDDEDRRHVGHVVNPRLVRAEGGTVRGPEGCLSLPGLEARTARADRVLVTGRRADGSPVRVVGSGFFARCLQHECDHLEGTLYPDRLAGLRRRRLLRAVRRTDWGREASATARRTG